MRTVLCFGDSNTYGYDPQGRASGAAERYPRAVRWCGVAQRALGDAWDLIEEGLNGRTFVYEDPWHIETHLSGAHVLPTLLKSHLPLDAVVIMLGTNDVKPAFSPTLPNIARSATVMLEQVRNFSWPASTCEPALLLVAPPRLRPQAAEGFFAEFDERSIELSEHFADVYRTVAQTEGCAFLDAASVASASDIDGIHLMPEGHEALGRAIASKLISMFA